MAEKAEARIPTGAAVMAATSAIIMTLVLALVVHYLRLPRIGLELPLVAFLVGLAISAATRGSQRQLFEAANPWVFVDASLIIIGLTAGFDRLGALDGKAGIIAVVNVAVGLAVGMLVALRLGLDERFSATFVSGATICGITAAIATGRTVRAEYAHLLISLLLIAVVGAPFAVGISLAAKGMGAVGGALVGAVVDSTPVVRSIAEAIGGQVEVVAKAVKAAQNSLIPLAAIALAVVVSRISGEEAEIPLSLLLMLIGAIVSPFLGLPEDVVAAWERARTILLGIAMMIAGLATPVEALKKPGVHLAIAVFVLIEIVNIVIAYGLGSALLG